MLKILQWFTLLPSHTGGLMRRNQKDQQQNQPGDQEKQQGLQQPSQINSDDDYQTIKKQTIRPQNQINGNLGKLQDVINGNFQLISNPEKSSMQHLLWRRLLRSLGISSSCEKYPVFWEDRAYQTSGVYIIDQNELPKQRSTNQQNILSYLRNQLLQQTEEPMLRETHFGSQMASPESDGRQAPPRQVNQYPLTFPASITLDSVPDAIIAGGYREIPRITISEHERGSSPPSRSYFVDYHE
ncbi:unnamed protein product [Protopolystoma xenopodis]|uniref:Uncharacterized protein n=1 Tax=Protopolystoma xenopodis TaxID=117903 RepID=A0A3S5A080_9PLAT|nr:unnamed protein product [Protopolystoma xenopodis]